MIEYVSKTFSMGMRLFGNMYAGELLFFLIALLGGSFAFTSINSTLEPRLAAGQTVLGTVWAMFHILIIAAAGVHLHDADAGLHRSGPGIARRALTHDFDPSHFTLIYT